jgi:hypothetical protein
MHMPSSISSDKRRWPIRSRWLMRTDCCCVVVTAHASMYQNRYRVESKKIRQGSGRSSEMQKCCKMIQVVRLGNRLLEGAGEAHALCSIKAGSVAFLCLVGRISVSSGTPSVHLCLSPAGRFQRPAAVVVGAIGGFKLFLLATFALSRLAIESPQSRGGQFPQESDSPCHWAKLIPYWDRPTVDWCGSSPKRRSATSGDAIRKRKVLWRPGIKNLREPTGQRLRL